MKAMLDKNILVIYHDKCPDGFGGALAAWKKFGDSAAYIPAGYGDPLVKELAGKEVYLVDFCYEKDEEIDEIARAAKKFVVLDHHESNQARVERAPEHVYDSNRSGASIAWAYFHPDVPLPRLMTYLEDGDLYRYALPETREVYSYLSVLPYEFPAWNDFMEGLEDDARRAEILERGRAYTEFFEAMGKRSVDRAKKVRFEGYEVYFATTHPDITMRSYVGHELYEKLPPFALVVSAHPNGFGVSLRGDGSVDVSKIAEKYGGGGHPGSAGFFIPNGEAMPWELIEES
ncbi:MAG TPA: DHH family phosphoesterase [Candidatus Paceibacterota bacterium]|nr:DHH family phosphoesterase [Candidatus Paceibacterota bacterium]